VASKPPAQKQTEAIVTLISVMDITLLYMMATGKKTFSPICNDYLETSRALAQQIDVRMVVCSGEANGEQRVLPPKHSKNILRH